MPDRYRTIVADPPCAVCNPVCCRDCGSTNPYLTDGVCRHRRACWSRQMMAAGVSSAVAARHAQQPRRYGWKKPVATPLPTSGESPSA